ncbi:MAG: hypothetical protein A2V88_14540 [Elusimicrobia bacterium RBG_16_66_12]|nr:MAG: hypothetical protein A2V88_14540 [Elusimicrobia bacterium RBG_16_66_12]
MADRPFDPIAFYLRGQQLESSFQEEKQQMIDRELGRTQALMQIAKANRRLKPETAVILMNPDASPDELRSAMTDITVNAPEDVHSWAQLRSTTMTKLELQKMRDEDRTARDLQQQLFNIQLKQMEQGGRKELQAGAQEHERGMQEDRQSAAEALAKAEGYIIGTPEHLTRVQELLTQKKAPPGEAPTPPGEVTAGEVRGQTQWFKSKGFSSPTDLEQYARTRMFELMSDAPMTAAGIEEVDPDTRRLATAMAVEVRKRTAAGTDLDQAISDVQVEVAARSKKGKLYGLEGSSAREALAALSASPPGQQGGKKEIVRPSGPRSPEDELRQIFQDQMTGGEDPDARAWMAKHPGDNEAMIRRIASEVWGGE